MIDLYYPSPHEIPLTRLRFAPVRLRYAPLRMTRVGGEACSKVVILSEENITS